MLTNSEGDRFMFDYVPEMYREEFADTEVESSEWVKEVVAGKLATKRRPPELLTRDVVAKAINSEKAAGRASEHGGAYLDISWRNLRRSRRSFRECTISSWSLQQLILRRADGGRPHSTLRNGRSARRPYHPGDIGSRTFCSG